MVACPAGQQPEARTKKARLNIGPYSFRRILGVIGMSHAKINLHYSSSSTLMSPVSLISARRSMR